MFDSDIPEGIRGKMESVCFQSTSMALFFSFSFRSERSIPGGRWHASDLEDLGLRVQHPDLMKLKSILSFWRRCCLFSFQECVYKIYTLYMGISQNRKPSQETPTLPKTEDDGLVLNDGLQNRNLLDSRGPPFFRSKGLVFREG